MLPQLIQTVASCMEIDAVFVVTGAGGGLATGVATKIVEATADLQPEIYVAWVGLTPEVAQTFDGSRVSVYADPLRAAKSAEACAAFRQGQQVLAGITATLELLENMTPAQGRTSVCGPGLASAAQMLTLVQAAGVPCAPFAIIDSIDGDKAAAAADSVGYPVVLKIRSPDISHKSDAGGVALNLADATALRTAADTMLATSHYRFGPGAREAFDDYLQRRITQPHFANARSVRNALDRIRLRQASRLFADRDRQLSADDLRTLAAQDIASSRVFQQPPA
jgi:acyl-CoA synthetase (NDP forming)